ncbi:MAG: hypothetical protein M3Y59_08165 [Myxococcota bacterium]|nr:hypothetical protein [Myxococcota bacterium]
MRPLSTGLALVLALTGGLALGAEAPAKKLTLLITGDNRGEIAPCG